MRERRTAGDPYWSYSGKLSFRLWPEPEMGEKIAHLLSESPVISLFYSVVFPAALSPSSAL